MKLREGKKGGIEFLGMELLGGKKVGTELLGLDGTFGREEGLNGTFRDGWNLFEGKILERYF